jgi:8-oxo-dGTP pyrophosphatase MutT (NUDIX family)
MSFQPHLFPVSVKGVVVRDGRVLLLRNERDEWELPGGKLDLGEEPPDYVVREITEEVGWEVTPIKKSIAAWYATLSTRMM